jgi:hypothetical protein
MGAGELFLWGNYRGQPHQIAIRPLLYQAQEFLLGF